MHLLRFCHALIVTPCPAGKVFFCKKRKGERPMTHLFTLSELPLSDITRLLDEAEAFR
ncbi:aspartate carbamoyltransferase, partial [Anoxybacillus geothermalis]|nr:aspartate carbamoyltransferase [Anoxybacillus geothermalis]